MTASWYPAQYARYSGPRLRPALDLLQRIPELQPRIIHDLGCGSGDITRLLAARWPEALTHGVDDSQAMPCSTLLPASLARTALARHA